jgi:regulator of nucleoside diphosphate kinase
LRRFAASKAFSICFELEIDMTTYNDLLVSASDLEALAPLLSDRRRSGRLEANAADALADVLIDARMVPHDRLPADRVSMNARVAYREEPNGESRTVAVVHPNEAAPSDGRISVLSPVGRALLGRRAGSVASLSVPGGRALTIRVLAVEPAPSVEEGAYAEKEPA